MSSADYVLNENNKPSSRAKENSLLEEIKKSKKTILENSCKKIDFKAPIISRDGKGIIYPNTINMIQGKSGVHKSRLVEVLIACLSLKEDRPEFLGFNSNPDIEFFSVYADTERNLNEQFPYAIQQIKRLAKIPLETIELKLDPFSFINITREDRFVALRLYLDDIRQKVKDHLFIVLDVVTDCINNFNDPKQSLELIDLMNKYINNYDLTFLCVIHENPLGNEKARGHLGTELFNKSSTVFQIGYESNDSELIKLGFKKCRSSKRFEPLYFMYSDEVKGLLLADQSIINETMHSKFQKAKIEDVRLVLIEALKVPCKKSDLLKGLKNHFQCGIRTLEERLKTIYEEALIITKDGAGQKWVLDKFTEGRATYYALVPSMNNDK